MNNLSIRGKLTYTQKKLLPQEVSREMSKGQNRWSSK